MKTLKLISVLILLVASIISMKSDSTKKVFSQKKIIAETFSDGKYVVDTIQSHLEWTGRKPGDAHKGTLMMHSGELIVNAGRISSGKIVVDMNSLLNTDIKDPDGSRNLSKHLKDKDFFDVDHFPTSTFEITKVAKSTDGKEYMIVGTMTIKGISKEISCSATFKEVDNKLIGSSELKIDRTRFDIKYKSKTIFPDLGDKFIYDDIELKLEIVAAK